jgi:hypothetical protein
MHKICEECKWNGYPVCLGTKMFNGEFMSIENLKDDFKCGQKNESNIVDFNFKKKSELEQKIDDLELRISELEGRG